MNLTAEDRLTRERGVHFDPVVVDVFIELRKYFLDIRLSSTDE